MTIPSVTPPMFGPRRLQPLSPTAAADLRQLVRAIAVGELLAPSRVLWLAADSLADAAVADDAPVALAAVAPDRGVRGLRLAAWLAALAGRGTTVVIAAAPSPQVAALVGHVRDQARTAASRVLSVDRAVDAPQGLAGDGFALSGVIRWSPDGPHLTADGATYLSGVEAAAAITRFAAAYPGAT